MTAARFTYPTADDPDLIDAVCVGCGDPCRVLADDDTPRCPFCSWEVFRVEHPDEAAMQTHYAGIAARGFAAIVNDINNGRRAA